MKEIYDMLEKLNVKYQRFEHEPVKTCAESTALLPPDLPGVRTKHLFLRDRKKRNYFLVVVEENKMVDIKGLSDMLEAKGLGMANEDELKEYLNAPAGALSMLALVYNRDNFVKLVIDSEIWEAEAFDCHPNQNGIVFLIMREDWLRIFDYLGIEPVVKSIPSKEQD